MVFPFSKPNELIYCFSNQQNQVILPPPKTSWLCLRVSEPTPKLGLLGYLANLRHGLNHLRSSSALQTKGVFVLQHKVLPREMPDQIKTVCHWIHIRGRFAVKTEPRSHHRHGLVDQTTSFEIFLFRLEPWKSFENRHLFRTLHGIFGRFSGKCTFSRHPLCRRQMCLEGVRFLMFCYALPVLRSSISAEDGCSMPFASFFKDDRVLTWILTSIILP